ncbi:MAG: SDR family NAD(P)-dependent oxidoreductase [Solirubrobacteraceae bacterium]|nr:SDR family NAD(P)-dependent oxidoreductase [Solirubrobacteraceae bacterium]
MSGMKISGARIVITGAGSGIGEATALRCARDGAADVICVDIDGDAAEATAAACHRHGAASSSFVCDVADSAAVQELADAIEGNEGPVDILVNNAGVGVAGPFLETSVDDWDWLISINLDGVAYGCHAFGPRMVERGRGQVVNIASAAAYLMSRDMPAYCASKAGVVALSRCLRGDWASHGVGVSVICPGVINTPIPTNSRMTASRAHQQERMQESFKVGHAPDLVAKAIVKAAEKDLELVPVGFESEFAYRVLPFVPGRVKGLMTKAQLGPLPDLPNLMPWRS